MKHVFSAAILAASIGCASTEYCATPEKRAEHYLNAKEGIAFGVENLILVSHRCKGFDRPENSLEAIEECIKCGIAGIEIDVRYSRDGVPVLMHDETIDRTCDGSGKVNNYTLAELRKFRLQGNDSCIPTLEETLGLCDHHVVICLDLKVGDLRPAVEVVLRKRMMDSVCWYLTSEEQYAQVAVLSKKYPGMCIFTPVTCEAELSMVERYKIPLQIAEVDLFTNDNVLAALRKKKVLISADISFPYLFEGRQFDRWWESGARMIQTDNPKEFIDRLDKEKYVKKPHQP